MAETFNAPADVNPESAGWLYKFVTRDGADLKLCDDPASRHTGVVTRVTNRLGGEMTVAGVGDVAEVEVGTLIDISANDLVTCDANAKAQPAASPNKAMGIALGQDDAAVGRLVKIRILDGLAQLV